MHGRCAGGCGAAGLRTLRRGRPRRSDGVGLTRGRCRWGLERRQRLKRTARLGAPFGLERTQVAAHAQLAAMFIHHKDVHEQVGGHHVELEIRAFDVQAGRVAHTL